MVPGNFWRWGWTEIAHWIMRLWCIDTLIKGKLRLRPFGCCGFDERGLSDSISTCRYGRSFWWLTLWKGTQHQCRITALICALPRLLLRWNLKSRPSSLGLHSRRSWERSNQISPRMWLRDCILESARAGKSCAASLFLQFSSEPDGIRWFVFAEICQRRSHKVTISVSVSTWQLDAAIKSFNWELLETSEWSKDTKMYLLHLDISQSCQILGLWYGLTVIQK